VRRFLSLTDAQQHLELLLAHPGYTAEARAAEKTAAENRERLKAARDSGRAGFFKKTTGLSINKGQVSG
jgi:hypothetical protein